MGEKKFGVPEEDISLKFWYEILCWRLVRVKMRMNNWRKKFYMKIGANGEEKNNTRSLPNEHNLNPPG